MPDDPSSGLLIAVEGIDGTGKSTQVRMLAQALEAAGEAVVTSREPTNGPYGQKIRRSAVGERLPAFEELLNLIRDRKQHSLSTIQPALEQGKIVILDRYFYSTLAYQGIRLGAGNFGRLDEVVRRYPPEPDLVFVLDMEPERAVQRISERDGAPNAFEKLETLTAVRAVFHRLCAADPKLILLDADRPEEEIHRDILRLLVSRLHGRFSKSLGSLATAER